MWSLKVLLYSLLTVNFCVICQAIKLPNTTLIEEAPLKIHLVEEIVKKICNISLNTFANKSPVEKANLIIKLEEKLNKSAQALGVHGAKYVKLIMKGVKAKAFDANESSERTTRHPQKVIHSDSDSGLSETQPPFSLRVGAANESKLVRRMSHKQKGVLVNTIAKKIELLAKRYLAEAKTPEERKLAVENVKQLLLESASHTQAIPESKQEELNKYVDLVARGVEVIMEKEAEANVQRKAMDSNLTHSINIGKKSQDHTSNLLDPIKSDSKLGRVVSFSSDSNSVSSNPDKKIDLSVKSLCDGTLKKTCTKIKLMKTLKCLSDNREFSILKLCDGKDDCLDSSDEKECPKQAIEIIRNVDRLINYIDESISHNCYPDLVDRSLLSKQNKILSEILKQQETYLDKQSLDASATNSRRMYDVKTGAIKETIHEAVNVVDSLTSALGTSMCPHFDGRKGWRSHEDFISENRQYVDENTASKPSPEICKCDGRSCANTCTHRCGQICLEMYTLGQLSCQAVSGEEFVSLDLICDGKLDCYDETDEKDCSIDVSLAKFEATNMYNYILKDIETKVMTVMHKNVRSRLQNLHALVIKYQKLSLRRNPDVAEVKHVRQELFEELMAVYYSAVQFIRKDEDLFEMRFYLVTLKERLISAVKRSNTGNEKIISSDGCVCRGYKCALPKCSKNCNRACSVEPQLTRFFCGKLSDPLNNSLPIELLCNGKANCPNEDDEKDCQIGTCRSLHLRMLAQKLQDCGRDHKGTALGEALRSWRIKAKATLSIAENNDRPTPPILHHILRGLLHDLVMAYSTLEDRHDSATVFQEFYTWSRVVMDTLKSCNS